LYQQPGAKVASKVRAVAPTHNFDVAAHATPFCATPAADGKTESKQFGYEKCAKVGLGCKYCDVASSGTCAWKKAGGAKPAHWCVCAGLTCSCRHGRL
jgi:hypothetical protein